MTTTEAMRLALDALEQVRKRADSANGICHLYEGDCPAPDQPDARDAGCPACKTIDASDAATSALRAALAAAPQPPAAQHGEAAAPDDMRDAFERWASNQHGEWTDYRLWKAACAWQATQPTAAPQPVAQGDVQFSGLDDTAGMMRVRAVLETGGVKVTDGRLLADIVKAAAPAGVVGEPVATLWQHCETGRTRVTMPDQVFTQDATWDIVGPLYLRAAPPARQALTNARITAMRQAGYLDADDEPDAWAYERGVRDAERAHGIGGKGETA